MFESPAYAACPRVRAGDPFGPVTRESDLLARAQAIGPGPLAMALLDTLDHDQLDDVERADLLEAWERNARWVAAQQTRAVLAVAGDRPDGRDDPAREYVRVALRDCGGSAKSSVDTARALAGPLRAVREAMEAGRLSYDHARVLTQETYYDLDPMTAAEIAGAVLERGELDTPSQFRRRVRRAVIKADPAVAEDRARQAARQRMVSKRTEPDSQASMFLTGPAADIATIWTTLDLLSARTSVTDGRTLDQRRFDSLVGLCSEKLFSDTVPSVRCGIRPAVYLYADAPTWLGLTDSPVDLDGYGPIPPGIARDYLAEATCRAMITDALTGEVVSVSDRTYRPSPRLRRLLHTRDRTCTFPGCTAAVWHCDADHAKPFDQGGCTDPENCALLCRRHHRIKTFHDWRHQPNLLGEHQWTDPTGRTWTRRRDRYLMPDSTAPPEPRADPPRPTARSTAADPDDEIPPF